MGPSGDCTQQRKALGSLKIRSRNFPTGRVTQVVERLPSMCSSPSATKESKITCICTYFLKETSQMEMQRKRKIEDLQKNFQRCYICTVETGADRELKAEETSQELMAGNFPKLRDVTL
jgi:hypothetical protein